LTENSQLHSKKRPKRLFLVLIVAAALIAVMGGAIILRFTTTQANYGPGPITIEATTEKSFYSPGEDVYFVISVNNSQDWPVPKPNLVGYSIEKDGVSISGCGVDIDYAAENIPTFSAHSQTSYKPPLIWNQKMDVNETLVQVQRGIYTTTITVSGFGYQTNCSTTFEIQPNP
jgi:hypothetical protein